MTYVLLTSDDVPPCDGEGSSWLASLKTAGGAAILALGVLSVGWVLNTHPGAPVAKRELVARPAASAGPSPYAPLLRSTTALGFAPVSWAESHPLASTFVPLSAAAPVELAAASPAEPTATDAAALGGEASETVMPDVSGAGQSMAAAIPSEPQSAVEAPMPAPRPPELTTLTNREAARPFGRSLSPRNRTAALAGPAPDNRTFLDKFFGMLRPSGPVLAYASPEDGVIGSARGVGSVPSLPYDRWTAVYDIAGHTVYMPNGARLEAHSGLGDRLDDPHHVHERMRGATPPHLYDLEPRAQLFHGVQALRLNPVGGGGVFGRTGLLAHTYMLGPNGDSNGCVSFKDYRSFLQAFSNGEVRRLAVVARLI